MTKNPSMIHNLYQKVTDLSVHPKAKIWLGIIAFIESSFFPIPADVIFIPMVMNDRKNAFKLAWIATISSVLGGILGYYIGYYGYETLAKPLLMMMGKYQTFEEYRVMVKQDIFLLWGLLLSSGLSHIPPIKVVTILAGVAHIGLGIFIISSVIGRGLRFFLLAYLFYKYGDIVKGFIEKYMNKILIISVLLIFIIYIGLKLW